MMDRNGSRNGFSIPYTTRGCFPVVAKVVVDCEQHLFNAAYRKRRSSAEPNTSTSYASITQTMSSGFSGKHYCFVVRKKARFVMIQSIHRFQLYRAHTSNDMHMPTCPPHPSLPRSENRLPLWLCLTPSNHIQLKSVLFCRFAEGIHVSLIVCQSTRCISCSAM